MWLKEAILAMLNLNSQPAADGSVVWKVLIYDRLGQQVISPLLKVNELREQGITVHMGLSKERLPIPDVPAVYFVQPTLENVKIIAQVLYVIASILYLCQSDPVSHTGPLEALV